MLQLSLAILTTLTLSLVSPHSVSHTLHPRRCCCCCCLQLVTMPLCEHPRYGVAHCRQELHATICSVVVSRYTRLDSFVVKAKAYCIFSLDDEFRGRFHITSFTHVHLSFNSPPHQCTHSTPSFSTPAFSAPPGETPSTDFDET